tara:strand:+ start:111 stop:491 length:381 start_codon:yes stop_codon:yes gene_type:complete
MDYVGYAKSKVTNCSECGDALDTRDFVDPSRTNTKYSRLESKQCNGCMRYIGVLSNYQTVCPCGCDVYGSDYIRIQKAERHMKERKEYITARFHDVEIQDRYRQQALKIDRDEISKNKYKNKLLLL